MAYRQAIFLDKDGTLIEDVPYNVDPRKIRLMPGVAAGLRRLSGLGYAFIVVTNQAGVARGYFREEALTAVESRLRSLLRDQGVTMQGFYYCPHHPEGTVAAYTTACNCRKPMPGMLLDAAARFGIRLEQSWMVGDILDDVEAGNRAGCKTILVDPTYRERRQITSGLRRPSAVADTFSEAATLMINQIGHGHE